MAALLSLPTELIVCIYANCPTLQSAASLSATNKRLYSIWLDDENHIVEAILSPQIPAYEAAVELAMLEEIWIKSNTQLSSTMDKPPIRLYLKRLLQTVDCASNTATLWNAERVRTWREARAPAPAHASYYLLRNIILSWKFSDPQLHEAIHLAFCAASEEEVFTQMELADFLVSDTAYHETYHHDGSNMRTSENKASEDEMDDKMHKYLNVDEWEYIRGFLSPWWRMHK